nr:endonuclease V [Legionella tunisiensis]
MPYCSGFLSFREVPAISKALDKLNKLPDLIVCDGQGVAHPRGFGLACHLGLAYDIPTIGCGKSRLYGAADEPGPSRGNFSYLYDKHKTIIGCVLRTRNGVKPVYVSTGHKISLPTACEWVLKLSPKYRLPETTRLADGYADEYKKSWLTKHFS